MMPGFAPRRRRIHRGLSRVVVTALMLEIVFAGLHLGSAAVGRDGAVPTIPSSDAQPAAVTLESGFAAASEQAARWDGGASLAAVTAYIYWPTSPVAPSIADVPSDGWTVYVFAAGRRALSIYVNRRTGTVVSQRAILLKEGLARRLDLTTFPVSSDIAVLIADLELGIAYRAACPNHRYLTQVTASIGPTDTEPSVPQWVVTYSDVRTMDRFDIVLRVNAFRGSVLNASDTSQPCLP